MALIKCSECAREISDKATVCPHCGNPLRTSTLAIPPASSNPQLRQPRYSATRKLGVSFVAFFVAVVAFMVYEAQRTNSSTSDAQDVPLTQRVADETNTEIATDQRASTTGATLEPTPAVPSVIEISASQLYAEYSANEVLADTKYKGQWLYVSGIVATIGKDILDDPYVTLMGNNELGIVQGMFGRSEIDRLAQLHKGEAISLTCRGRGMTLANVMLDCTSDNVPPPPRHDRPTAATPQTAEN